MQGLVVAVSASPRHSFSKPNRDAITVVAGVGVAGDAHSGPLVKHRSAAKRHPNAPNLRQVHLIHAELFDELAGRGLDVAPGQMGENITTRGLDLLALPVDSLLHVGDEVVLRLTGLRNPCSQIDGLLPGLMAAVLDKTPDGRIVRKAGVMSVVVAGGVVRPGDRIGVRLPPEPRRGLEPV